MGPFTDDTCKLWQALAFASPGHSAHMYNSCTLFVQIAVWQIVFDADPPKHVANPQEVFRSAQTAASKPVEHSKC